MIISASYRTDIPTFYGEWFMNRLDAGYCLVKNPYSRRLYRVSLEPGDVDGFVFWTKNLGPFLPRLAAIRARGFPFIVQYTITGYPRELEESVVDAALAVEHMRRLAGDFGPRAAVWRYDTILATSLTGEDFHRANFARLARELAGSTDEVVVSCAQIYFKTRRNLEEASRRHGFTWQDPAAESKAALLAELAACARANGMRVTVCSQPGFVSNEIGEARCIDAERLSEVAGRLVRARLKGNREGCGCFESRDIGDYDTCPQGCVYCYAVRHRELATERYRRHDPLAETLLS